MAELSYFKGRKLLEDVRKARTANKKGRKSGKSGMEIKDDERKRERGNGCEIDQD
jgi:hypothetical protein